ncbi:hypothetical protein BG005_004335 [Podila minutissima]|nr:hypothetical protein BG005_004335 [Podila minutissima]
MASLSRSDASNGSGGGLHLKFLKLRVRADSRTGSEWGVFNNSTQLPPVDEHAETLTKGALMQFYWNLISNNPFIERLDVMGNYLFPEGEHIPGDVIPNVFPEQVTKLKHVKEFKGWLYCEYPGTSTAWEWQPVNLSRQYTSICSLYITLTTGWDKFLRHFPNLEQLRTDDMLDEPLSRALTSNCPRLREFALGGEPAYVRDSEWWRPYGHPTNRLLVSMSHLRVLNSVVSVLYVDEMLRQPWACMGLEQLTCRIIGFARLTNEEEDLVNRIQGPGPTATEFSAAEAMAVEKFERCCAQQHGVYDRLASLTRLKHLDLGFEN